MSFGIHGEFFEISQLLLQTFLSPHPTSLRSRPSSSQSMFQSSSKPLFSCCRVTLSFLSCLSSLLFSKLLNMCPKLFEICPPEFQTYCPLLRLTTKNQWTTHPCSPQSPACSATASMRWIRNRICRSIPSSHRS